MMMHRQGQLRETKHQLVSMCLASTRMHASMRAMCVIYGAIAGLVWCKDAGQVLAANNSLSFSQIRTQPSHSGKSCLTKCPVTAQRTACAEKYLVYATPRSTSNRSMR